MKVYHLHLLLSLVNLNIQMQEETKGSFGSHPEAITNNTRVLAPILAREV